MNNIMNNWPNDSPPLTKPNKYLKEPKTKTTNNTQQTSRFPIGHYRHELSQKIHATYMSMYNAFGLLFRSFVLFFFSILLFAFSFDILISEEKKTHKIKRYPNSRVWQRDRIASYIIIVILTRKNSQS